ncbi:hypothetical protein BCY84_09333 [Trypanosoma cruzi cruzi]|nr:hypothetical protein BCY84_09333 [Trypanosoma cruzi cruzi]
MKKKYALRVRRGSHLLWKCCTACGGIALKCRTITHEDVAQSGRSFLCLRDVDAFEGLPLCTMAAACDRHSVLLGNMLPCFHVCVASGTMCRRLCNCRMEGEEWREVRERRGQGSRWVSRRGGHFPPWPAPLVPGTFAFSHCSILVDATSTRRGSGCRHRHKCDRNGTRLLLRSEGALRVAQWRAQKPLAESHTTPGTGRRVLRVAVAAPNFLSTCMLVRVKGNVHVRIYPCGVCAVTAVPHGYGTVA